MYEWGNLYRRCQFVHMCLRRGLHWNTLRDRWDFEIVKPVINIITLSVHVWCNVMCKRFAHCIFTQGKQYYKSQNLRTWTLLVVAAWKIDLANKCHDSCLKPQSHQACDQVTTYLRPKNGPIVERTYDWWQRSHDWWQRWWVIARRKSVATRS